MENKFKVVEVLKLNNKVVDENMVEYNTFNESYGAVKEKLSRYLKALLDTEEIDEFSIYGNGLDFIIKDSYYVDTNLEKEEINITIMEKE